MSRLQDAHLCSCGLSWYKGKCNALELRSSVSALSTCETQDHFLNLTRPQFFHLLPYVSFNSYDHETLPRL